MIFTGEWTNDSYYRRGNIVYISSHSSYHICSLNHQASEQTHPFSEFSQSVYWIPICENFLVETTFKKSCLTDTFLKESAFIHYSPIVPASPTPSTVEEVRTKFVEQHKQSKLKRKLEEAENELTKHKKQKTKDYTLDLRDKLMLLKIDLDTKAFLLDKYETAMRLSGAEYSKQMGWFKLVSNIPFGSYKNLQVRHTDSHEKIKTFFDDIRNKMDASIYGLDHVKQEVLEFVARKITNPDGKGHVLALCGNPGVGKTKIIHSLAQALDLPFYQINCGGLNDASVLMGHSETYVGSKCGKLVEILVAAKCMNPIIYIDEVDKISEAKAREINGILTHLLDEEQNDKFQDNYLSNINLDFSKAFFVLSFNDPSKVDSIVFDRMKVIYIGAPSTVDKVKICQDKMIPEIVKTINFKENKNITIDTNLIEYIITMKSPKEEGVRQLRKTFEKLLTRLNYDVLTGTSKLTMEGDTIVLTKTYIDNVLNKKTDDEVYMSMYS